MTTSGLPAASGARLAGDDYQHAFTWLYALKLVFEGGNVTKIEFEADDAGNVDDLIVHRSNAPTLYNQIKFVTSQAEPLTHIWFTTTAKAGQKTPLQRFYESYQRLSSSDGKRPEMALQTNRWPADGDPLLACVAGENGKLLPRLAGAKAGSAAGKIRRAWATHLEVGEPELLEFLQHLAIRAGRDALDELEEKCGLAMRAAGYRDDPAALLAAVGAVRKLIRTGTKHLEADGVREIVTELALLASEPRATLLVQAVAHDPWPEAATASVDWVDLLDGDEPGTRRQLRDPDDWNRRLKPELVAAVEQIKRSRLRNVEITGAMRLTSSVLVGEQLSEVAGFKIKISGRDGDWTSSTNRQRFDLDRAVVEIGHGGDVAVALAISQPIKDDILDYIEAEGLPIAQLIVYTPEGGASRDSITSPEHGLGAADAISAALRSDTRKHETLVHLFLATPLPLAVFVGHLWNRMPPTQLYEDRGAGGGYFPSFTL